MLRNLILVLTGATLLAQAPRYTIHDLGPLNPANGTVTGINSRGQVIGYETLPDGRVRSFRTTSNSPINWTTDDLHSLGGSITRARAINASGQVVGESSSSAGDIRAFRTAPNTPINPATDNLGTLAGTTSQALAINDSGQVTGSSDGHAFLTAPNSPINPATDNLDPTLGPMPLSSGGLNINNAGHVLGSTMGGPIIYPTAFLRGPRTTAILDFVAAPEQDFVGLTERDQIVLNSGPILEMWQGGRKTVLANCAAPCIPASVNNSLEIVGATRLAPFLYSGGTLYDLGTLIPQASGWTLSTAGAAFSAWAINDARQIAGIGTLNNETHAFRLDPVPSVSTAIEQAMNALAVFYRNLGRKGTPAVMAQQSLESKLQAALASWNAGNAPATRGLLNEFEALVRAQAGQTLSADQAKQLLDLAEAAIGLT